MLALTLPCTDCRRQGGTNTLARWLRSRPMPLEGFVPRFSDTASAAWHRKPGIVPRCHLEPYTQAPSLRRTLWRADRKHTA